MTAVTSLIFDLCIILTFFELIFCFIAFIFWQISANLEASHAKKKRDQKASTGLSVYTPLVFSKDAQPIY